MSVVTMSSVSVQFGTRMILNGIDLAIEPEARLGLLGRNGAGKSTLLGVLGGRLKPDTGTIEVHRGARVGILDQAPAFEPGVTVRSQARSAFSRMDEIRASLEEVFDAMATAGHEALPRLMNQQTSLEAALESLGGWDVEHRVDAVLHGVGIKDAQFTQEACKLSGGERARLALARLLLESPDVLLLDEPTNHLDLDGCQWLESFLKNSFGGAVVIVSHDRWLLDAVCTSMVDLQSGTLDRYPGNYTNAVQLRAERRTTMQRQWEKQQDHVRREEAFIRKYKAGQRAKQARGRQSRLDRFKRDDVVELDALQSIADIRIPPAPRSGDLVLSVASLQIAMGDRVLVPDITLDVRRGERIGIVGPNGAGKTTLIRCLLGEHPATKGAVEVGTGLRVGWFRQLQDHLDPEACVWEWVQRAMQAATGDVVAEQAARDLAGAFLFSGDQQDRLLGTLSGGERSRAALAGLLGGGHNVLVLDEPTNHVDIETSERLETVLGDGGAFTGTLLLISHDRALLERTCSRLITFEEGGVVRVHEGPLSTWLTSRAAGERTGADSPDEAEPKKVAPARGRQDPLDRLTVQALESRMELLEARLAELAAAMNDESVWTDAERMQAIAEEQSEVGLELERVEAAWLRRSD